jgi:hypothetical protein
MIVAHNLSPQESSKEIGKNVEKSVRQTKQIITKSMEENETDATILLSMGKSYSKHERERLGLCYLSKSEAEQSMLKRNEQELEGKIKQKKHHGAVEYLPTISMPLSTCPPFPGASLDFNDFRLYLVANFVQFTIAFLGFFSFLPKSYLC